MTYQIVIDTNVLIAGLRSRRGASFLLLSMIGTDKRFEINLSIPLVLEYEDVAKRPLLLEEFTEQDIDDVIDYLCSVGNHRQIFYLWRPFLQDPKDDMVLELAVEAQCQFIVTHNKRDFANVEEFGLRVLNPQEFLLKINQTV